MKRMRVLTPVEGLVLSGGVEQAATGAHAGIEVRQRHSGDLSRTAEVLQQLGGMRERPAEGIRVAPAIVIAIATRNHPCLVRLASGDAEVVHAVVEEGLTGSDEAVVTAANGATVKRKPVVPDRRPRGIEDPI